VLAARLGRKGMPPGSDIVVGEWAYGTDLLSDVGLPQLAVRQGELADAVRPAGKPLQFRAGTKSPAGELELIPFHRIAHERYSLYWQLT
jgi:hypothetical protein